jgi:hypothetical protein
MVELPILKLCIYIYVNIYVKSHYNLLTHWVALRPDSPYFIILLCLTSDEKACQEENAGA